MDNADYKNHSGVEIQGDEYMNLKNRLTNIERLIFVLSSASLLFLALFSWGYLSAKFQFFPYDFIHDAQHGIEALKRLYILEVATNRSAHEITSPSTKGGVTLNKRASDDGIHILLTLFRDDEFMAQLIDRQGSIVHEWQIPFEHEKLSKAKDTGISLSDRHLTINGTCISGNGDLYIVIAYRGLLKLNKFSEILWTIDLPIHHAVSFDSDGSVWTLSRRKVKREDEWIPLIDHGYVEDQVIHISSDGQIIDKFSLLDVISQNQYEGILYGGHPGKPTIVHGDPLHTNDIDILTKEQASHFPSVQEGDLMISMRTISTIFILDRRTHAIKWSMTGPFLRQHDPEVSRDGSLLIYDNRTSRGQVGWGAKHLTAPQELGYSRIIAVNPVTRHIVWQYQGSKESPFYSSIQGMLREMQSGNILVVEPEGGRIFEVEKTSGDIVWEFVNLVEEGVVGRVTGAIPLTENQIDFLRTE